MAVKKNKMDIMNWSIQARRLFFYLMVTIAAGVVIFLLISGNNWIQQHRGLTFTMLGAGGIVVLSIVWMGLVGAGESNGVALKKTIVFGVFIFSLVALLNIFSNIKK